jgi:hypothetical protein
LSYLEIIHHHVPETFFERFYYETGFYRLWIISPWLSPLESRKITLTDIFQKIIKERIRTHIITRWPEYSWHKEALEIAGGIRDTEIILNNNLHAKLYIALGQRRSLGLLGSANLTAKGNTGIEIGILIRNFREGTELIHAFVNTANYIRAADGRTRVKEFDKSLDLSTAK